MGDTSLASISGLGIPQVRALKQEIAKMLPASNLPAFLLQGLMQLKGRSLDSERIAGDLRVLFRETRQLGLYGTFIAAPAVILAGYQRLLTLAGKDIDSAFPEGTWQFYTEFGLREDAARHSVETQGFSRAAAALSEADAAACWVYAALHTLFCYDDLVANEWHEKATLRSIDLAIQETDGAGRPRRGRAEERAENADRMRSAYGLGRLAAGWATRRPYHGPPGNRLDGYAAARREAFDRYIGEAIASLPAAIRTRAEILYAGRRGEELPAYQAQMSVHRTLRAEAHSDRRRPVAFHELCVALVSGGVYHLIDLCERDEKGSLVITPRDADPTRPGQSLPLVTQPDGTLTDSFGHPVQVDRLGNVRLAGTRIGRLRRAPLAQVRAQVAAALRAARPLRHGGESDAPPTDLLLAAAPRGRQEQLRALLSTRTRDEIERLRRAPIIVAWDRRDRAQPLGAIRRGRRGVGDHPLTIQRAGEGVVFDMSHIFFDGAWGSALAETMTGFAVATAGALAGAGRPSRAEAPPALMLAASPPFLSAAAEVVATTPAEAWAETRAISLNSINALRRRLADREIDLTVNDFLLLTRFDHAASYRPGPITRDALAALAVTGPEGARLSEEIVAWLEAQRSIVPALLIPMDASTIQPRQRLHPAALRNPCPDLLPRLERCEELLRRLGSDEADRLGFEAERSALTNELVRFGIVLKVLREVTTRGEGFNTTALKLLGHLPRSVQSLIDLIPQKIDVLNEIVKGSEVFSNIGQAARGSSITRFMSARDDGESKQLIWGVMSDAEGRLVVTLRDFRPHVGRLRAAGHDHLADLLAHDFLDDYAERANALVRRLQRVLSHKEKAAPRHDEARRPAHYP